MAYKLIAIDLDGTLLDDNMEISRRNKQAIRRALDKGVRVTLCSGRPFDMVKGYAKELGLKLPFIINNGAMIVTSHDHKVVYKREIDYKKIKPVLDYAQQRNIKMFAFIDNIMYTNIPPDDKEIEIWRRYGQKFVYVEEFYRYINENLIKLMFVGECRQLKEYMEDLEKCCKNKFIQYLMVGRYLEFVPIDVNKGSALKYLASYYGIRASEVMAIGDEDNDIPMLKFAGLGVAMGNAYPHVKEVADFITDTNDAHGVAKSIEKFVLGD